MPEPEIQELSYDMATSVAKIGGPSERWLKEQIRAGRFPARLVGRAYRMTDADIADALEIMRVANCPRSRAQIGAGLTPKSRQKVRARS
jgi:hypothetical protein